MNNTSNLYVVVYNTPILKNIDNSYNFNENTEGFINKLKEHNWHFDIGDDPSFYQYFKETNENNLTWGICRPNIRNVLKKDDVVLFFNFCSNCNAYFLTGFATVDRVIKQTDIWIGEVYKKYRNYFNLLIKQNFPESNWIHYEPLLNENHKHKDWLRRLLNCDENILKFELVNESIKVLYKTKGNYIIFCSNNDDTYILINKQIKIATWDSKSKKEKWLQDEKSTKIKEFTFGLSCNNKYGNIKLSKNVRDSLRVHERNQAHVHVKFNLTKDCLKKWKTDFKNYLESIK